MEHVNSQTLEMYRQKVEKAVNKQRRQNISSKIVLALSYLFFELFFLLTAWAAMSIIEGEQAVFPFVSDFLYQITDNSWFHLLAVIPLAIIALVVPYIFAFVVALIVNLLTRIFTPKKILAIEEPSPLAYLKKLSNAAWKIRNHSSEDMLSFMKHPFLVFFILFIVTTFPVLYFTGHQSSGWIPSYVLLTLFFGGIFFVLHCFAFLAFGAMSEYTPLEKVKNGYKLHEEISKLYDKEKELVEKEQAAIRAAQKAQEAAERKAEGTRIYEQAVAADAADEALVKRTADMGCEEARLAYAKILLLKFFSNMFTNEEEVNIMKQIEKYLNPIRHKTVETEFLWLCAHTYDASLGKEEWTDVLQQFRVISASGQLPEEYTDLLNAEIKDVISIINKYHDAPPPSPAPSRPVHQQTSSSRPMSFSEKEDYSRRRFGALYSYAAIEAIDSDPNLTPSQKEDLKHHLKYYGD